MSEQMQEEYGDNGIRLSAAELFRRWKRAVKHGEVNLQFGMAWMDEAKRLAKLNALLVAKIETLRGERDEARRELCVARRELCRYEAIVRLQRHRVHRDSEDVVGLAKEIAVERGWDCFKENSDD